jgi:hypothetical protein
MHSPVHIQEKKIKQCKYQQNKNDSKPGAAPGEALWSSNDYKSLLLLMIDLGWTGYTSS